MTFPPRIADYYRLALDNLHAEVSGTPDDRVLGLDPEEGTTYLIAKYGMEPIKADFAAVAMEEVERRSYPAILVTVPVEPSDTFDVIAKQGLAGQGAWLGFDYRTFFSEDRPYVLGQVESPEPNHVVAATNRISEYVRSLNNAIEQENKTFPERVRQTVKSRQDAIRAKNKHLDDLSAAVGIPLVKRADISTVVPTAVKVKKSVTVIAVPPAPRRQERRVLERDKFDAIMELIDNQCRAFERTPTVYRTMGEEALRDVIVGALNAVFAGAAVGEAFSVLGKTDIHLRISRGEVFIAEIKIWDGPASLAELVTQLLERLTWRDGFGVAVVFSRNTDFGQVLRVIEGNLSALPRAMPGTATKESSNHFVAQFTLPSDASSHAEIHVVVYNLFTERPSGRTS